MLQTITQQPITIYEPTLERIVDMVIDTLDSPASKRVYAMCLRQFLTWYVAKGRPQFSAQVVKTWRAELQAAGMKASSINIRLVAVRRLAAEAADNAVLDEKYLPGILRIKGMRAIVTRMGNWLSKEDAERLINAPNVTTIKGARDRAALALMLGCGLRRTEIVNLEFKHLQNRDGRWVILDMIGKGNKVRTVSVPLWAKTAVDHWATMAGLKSGPIVRGMNRCDNKFAMSARKAITPAGLRNMVHGYGQTLGLDIAPHDLRRTYAKLARKGGAAIEQISISLGHASIMTTERYLGTHQSLVDAPCDHLGLQL